MCFPYSNADYTQLFGGETAECVAHGRQDLFHRIGGVPTRLVFDNAIGVGRRVGENVRMAEVFLRFKAHYGFDLTFCNPYASHEKGNVENKVGYIRRNLFVPLPTVIDVQAFNLELLDRCEADWQREHYKKGAPIGMYSRTTRRRFSICRNHRLRLVDTPASKRVVVRIGAHTLEPLAPNGEPISVHIRRFGKQRTDNIDVRTTLSRLLHCPRAWQNSILRKAQPERLREEIDGFDRSQLKKTLQTMQDLSGRYGFDTALQAMEEAAQLGRLTSANSVLLAARLATFQPEEGSGVDLSVYDKCWSRQEVCNDEPDS